MSVCQVLPVFFKLHIKDVQHVSDKNKFISSFIIKSRPVPSLRRFIVPLATFDYHQQLSLSSHCRARDPCYCSVSDDQLHSTRHLLNHCLTHQLDNQTINANFAPCLEFNPVNSPCTQTSMITFHQI